MKSYEQLTTPCFVFDEDEFLGNIQAFKNSFEACWGQGGVIVGYSVKTTPIAGLISCAVNAGCYAEVVSDDEFALSLEAGCPVKDVIFNGPIKTKPWLDFAFDHGCIVNIDSKRELAWTIEYAKRHGSAPCVGLRINFDLEAAVPGQSMAEAEGVRFGFCFEDGSLGEAIGQLRAAGIEPAGLHAHFSTKDHLPETFAVIARSVCEIKESFALNSLSYVDMGGGYYGGGLRRSMYDDYARAITEQLLKAFDPNNVALVVEPGGSVLCTPGFYLGRVIDTKTVRDRTFVVTELSKLNLNSTAFARRGFSYELLIDSDRQVLDNQILCGYTCIEMDRLCDLVQEPELQVGDLVLIKNAGAYTASFTPQFFIQAPPGVYLQKVDGTFEELVSHYHPEVPSLERI